jgi:hypothetical protein
MIDFDGSGEVTTLAQIPSTGVQGYDGEEISDSPEVARYGFDVTKSEDLIITWRGWSEAEDAISVWVNGTNLHPNWRFGGSDWQRWFTTIGETRLRSSGNVLEFRHERNALKSSNYEHWGVKDVALWKSYLAKPAGARLFGTSVQKVQLGNPYPSPFNGTVTLPISLGETTILTVEVVNLLGQRVISLQGGPLEPGEHVFTWRGTDRHGQRVTSGVYIVVVRFNGSTLTRRVLYLQ